MDQRRGVTNTWIMDVVMNAMQGVDKWMINGMKDDC